MRLDGTTSKFSILSAAHLHVNGSKYRGAHYTFPECRQSQSVQLVVIIKDKILTFEAEKLVNARGVCTCHMCASHVPKACFPW